MDDGEGFTVECQAGSPMEVWMVEQLNEHCMMDPEQHVALPGWLLYGYTCVCMACVRLSGGQKDVSDSLELELQEVVSLSCGCWDPKPDPFKEQPALLTSASSLASWVKHAPGPEFQKANFESSYARKETHTDYVSIFI